MNSDALSTAVAGTHSIYGDVKCIPLERPVPCCAMSAKGARVAARHHAHSA